MFENLGITLRLLRLLRGASQVSIARKAGLGKSQLSKYESGKELPRLDSLERLLTALKVTFPDLALTLSLIGERRADLTLDRTPETGKFSGSILGPDVQAAFEQVQTDVLRLHREVLSLVLQTPKRSPGPSQGKAPGVGHPTE